LGLAIGFVSGWIALLKLRAWVVAKPRSRKWVAEAVHEMRRRAVPRPLVNRVRV
jgi:hypothetical protein